MSRGAIAIAVGLAATCLTAFARPAAAYVRYMTNSGKPFHWAQSCVALTAFPKDLSQMMTVDEVMSDVNASAATWSKISDACTYLHIDVASSMDDTPRAINDGHNNVIFRTGKWCKLLSATECDTTVTYDPAALALTSVSASTSSGIIRDADIEVNASNFRWADLVVHPELTGPGQTVHDLQNAVTHEMGHLIGLDHTCYLQPPAPLDNNGDPIPDCADASPDVLATTMFPSANPGDVDKRTLAPDDQQGVCDIYPAAMDPMVCAPAMVGTTTSLEGCSCGTGGAPAPLGALAAVVAAALLLAARARRAPASMVRDPSRSRDS